MEIQVKKLRDALELLAPVVPRKTTLPVCTYARLGDGLLSVTDLTVAVQVSMPDTGEPVLLPAKSTLEFLKFAPGHELASISYKDKTVTITVGDIKTELESQAAEEFPPLPQGSYESEGVLDGEALVHALTAAAPYAASDDTRPVLASVHLEIGEAIEAAAADGFRLVWFSVPGKLSGPSMNIPLEAVKVLEHLWKKAATPDLAGVTDVVGVALAKRFIRLNWNATMLRLNFGTVSMTARFVQGSFPNYRQLIPKGDGPSVTLMAEDMELALNQVRPVSRESKGIVRLQWKESALTVSASSEGRGAVVPLKASCTEPGRTGLDVSYLRHYIRGRTGPVTITAPTPSSPILFSHRGLANTVIMPMFVQWPGEAKPKSPEAPEAKAEAPKPEAAEKEPETQAEPKPKRGRKVKA